MATRTKNLAKKKKVIHGDHYHGHSPISNLSMDILTNILCRLPVKIIIRCKLVCKEWRDTITDARFAEAHHDPTMSSLCIVSYDGESDSIYLSEVCKNQVLSSRFTVGGFITNGCMFEVVNSCHGFLLLRMRLVACFDLRVYNPLTSEHLKLPRVKCWQARGCCVDPVMTSMLGLGFSPVRKLYKVLMFVTLNNVPELQVHTVGTDVWRSVVIKKGAYDNLQLMRDFKREERQPLALNGVLHWLDAHQTISCFDVDKEELSCMYPPGSRDSVKYIVSIGMVRGLLSLGITLPGNSRNVAEIWVMKEYGVTESWTKYIVLKDHNIRTSTPIFSKPRLVDVCDNKKIVVLSEYQICNLRVYNSTKERSKRVKVTESNQEMSAEVYVPSFFSIRTHMLGKTAISSN